MSTSEAVKPFEVDSQSGYARRDHRIVDYQLYRCPDTNLLFRGPEPKSLRAGEYVACLGAAQTFGCFVERPYPVLLQECLGLPVLNLGHGGAGASFFLMYPQLLDRVNRSALAVVQVMSARSESNSLFDSGGGEYLTRRADGRRMSAVEAYAGLLRSAAPASLRVGQMEAFLFFGTPEHVKKVIEETRANCVQSHKMLLSQIHVPTVVLYLSKRRPSYREHYLNVQLLMREFPQLVNAQMIDEIRRDAVAYVECVSRRGLPQRLVDRRTGEPTSVDLADDRPDFVGKWTANRYYPSPEMHEDAARLLKPVCSGLLAEIARGAHA
jgi:hypothetical protein